MEPIGDEVRAEVRRAGGESGAGDVGSHWAEVVGEEIARNAWPARLQSDGTLVVHVRDAIWGFELTQRAGEISARLRGRPRLRFVPGPLPEEAPPPPPEALPAPTPEQARAADEMASAIADPELRESVAKVIKAALARTSDGRSI